MFKLLQLGLLTLILLVSQQAQCLQDPTRPTSYRAVGKKQQLKLESVLVSPSRRVAVINGQVVGEGDKIGSAKVIQIRKEGVKISNNGKLVELVLKRPAIRQEK